MFVRGFLRMLSQSIPKFFFHYCPLLGGAWLAMIMTTSCSFTPKTQYLLKLEGAPNTSCKITKDHTRIGTYIVPSTVDLGTSIGTIEAACRLGNDPIHAKIRVSETECRDQLVVKGPCSKRTTGVESVEIIVRKAK